MARTILNIYDQIILEKETHGELSGLHPSNESSADLIDDLNSASKVAVWRLWAYLVAVAIHIHETLWDQFKVMILIIAANAPAGTPRWYRKKVLEFQFGDPLVYKDNQYQYDILDETKKIVTLCAIEERAGGVVVVKVAKTVNDESEPLDTLERLALESYMHKIKFAGTRLAVLSIPADTLDINFDIYYDPIIPLSTIHQNVQKSIDKYRNETPFNGAVNITAFEDALQTAEGVLDPVFVSASNTPFGGGLTAFTVEVIPAAGWFDYANTADNLFNYIPKT